MKLEQSQSALNRFLDTMPQIVWSVDNSGNALYFNQRWWDYTGLKPHEYQKESGLEIVHPDDRAMVIQLTEECFKLGTVFEAQYRIRSALGTYQWHLGKLVPLRNEAGKIDQWIGTTTNVDEMMEAKSRFSAFFEQSSLPMEIYSLEGVPVQVNRAWELLFDTKLDQLEGYNVLTDPQIKALGITLLIERAIQGEAVDAHPFFYDPELIGKRGRGRWLEASFFPVKDQQHRVRELAMILRDVTDRENAESNLREANQKLEDAVKARQELLNICGHELKTPLSSLRMQTQTAKRRIAKGDQSVYEPEKVQKLLDSYGNQIERLVHLVDDMLDLTRISSGKLNLTREKIVLSTLVLEVLDRFGDQLSAAGCSISTTLGSNVVGNWDRFRIEQVVANLLTNSLKYGAGKPISVMVSKDVESGLARISVKDEGSGIAPENHERIFNRFERAVSANEVSGLGLGLFITKEIVTNHLGTIRVESAPGSGSCFIVELPLADG